jgi:hypothetical protein
MACVVVTFLPSSALAQTKPFEVNGIAVPLIGSNYLEDSPTPPGWTTHPGDDRADKGPGCDRRLGHRHRRRIQVADRQPPGSGIHSLGQPARRNRSSRILKALKAAGLRVTLDTFVAIAFDANGNLLDTVHPQPTDFKVWITAHTAIMLHLADLARQGGADRFSAISDVTQILTYGTAHEDEWVAFLAKIRAAFPGVLTSNLYASGDIFAGGNTHIDLTPRPIIDFFDEIGIGWAAAPITSSADPTLAQLIAGWRSTAKGWDSIATLKGVTTSTRSRCRAREPPQLYR